MGRLLRGSRTHSGGRSLLVRIGSNFVAAVGRCGLREQPRALHARKATSQGLTRLGSRVDLPSRRAPPRMGPAAQHSCHESARSGSARWHWAFALSRWLRHGAFGIADACVLAWFFRPRTSGVNPAEFVDCFSRLIASRCGTSVSPPQSLSERLVVVRLCLDPLGHGGSFLVDRV